MSNKLRQKAKVKEKQAGSKTSSNKKMPAAFKQKSLVQSNPKLSTIVLVATYFLLDFVMMDGAEETHRALVVMFTLLASSTLYGFYVNDYQRGLFPQGGTDIPKFVKNKVKYAVFGWLAITIWGIIFITIEPLAVPRFFPMIDSTYHQSQIVLMLFIAPVMEEIIFRYLLYDRWLKRKWGWFWGFMAASLIFVVCHPVTNLHSLVIYWAPTVLFFLIYNEFGLYGSILIHMVYNMMAI